MPTYWKKKLNNTNQPIKSWVTLTLERAVRLFSRLNHKLDYLPKETIKQIFEAYQVAAEAHKDQKRQSGKPYITHPLAVATILAEMRMDSQTIMAALLHDVIEDTAVKKEVLAEKFGDAVAELVDGVSKLTRIEFKNKAEAQAENFHKMVLAMSRDIRVVIIKLTDRLHNMRTLESVPPEKRHRIAKETLEIYAPIANRLGMHTVFTELENLGFSALYPERYRILKDTATRMVGNQKKIMHTIYQHLHQGLTQHNLLQYQVTGREKNLYSIYTKMRSRGLSFQQITDVYGFRIITSTIDECYRILGIVHSLYKPLPERFKDYIAIPKANGYQSLHTTLFGPFGIPIEIQIRTHSMDQLANNGIAAHWLYKSQDTKTADSAQLRAQQWVKNLLEMQQKTGNSMEFIENVKIDLFPDEVYIFTPTGKIMELPRGASVIDFAYAVHTDIGNTCVAAKIDRQLSPLSTTLLNGQTVEIITSTKGRPNPAWLDFVVTARARSGIRHYIHTQRRKESIVLGKELLNQALKHFSLSLKKISPQTLQKLMQVVGAKTLDELLEDIGLGNRLAILIAHQLATGTQPVTANLETEFKPLLIKGTEGMVIHFARCCYPIPGDPIAGVLTAGEGLMIHMESCLRIKRQQRYPEKLVTVSWSEHIQGEFIAALYITAANQRGVLAKLAQSIANSESNIDDLTIIERDPSHYTISFKLYVFNRAHLAQIIRNLRHIKIVLKVIRKV